jgi:hypothetical protein
MLFFIWDSSDTDPFEIRAINEITKLSDTDFP